MTQLVFSPSQLDWPPNGLVSLWDMINFHFTSLYSALTLLERHIEVASQAEDQNASVSSLDKPGAMLALDQAEAGANRLALKPPRNWIWRTRYRLSQGQITNAELAAEFRVIIQSIEDETMLEHFYHYPRDKADQLVKVTIDWAAAIAAFPSAEHDIRMGVDCYACDHHDAAVFHMMRVAEYGLRALATERGVVLSKPLSHEVWAAIIDAIEKKAEEIKQKPAGPVKDEALAFYNGAVGSGRALKDKFRNRVMYARDRFNPHEAADAIFQARTFMLGLARHVNEGAAQPIDWKF